MILATTTIHTATTEMCSSLPMEAMLFLLPETHSSNPSTESNTQMESMLIPRQDSVLEKTESSKKETEMTVLVIKVTRVLAEWLKKIEEEI